MQKRDSCDQQLIDDEMMFDDDDFEETLTENCGRWLNGRLMPSYRCTKAGSEECDWECPLRRLPRAKSGKKSK